MARAGVEGKQCAAFGEPRQVNGCAFSRQRCLRSTFNMCEYGTACVDSKSRSTLRIRQKRGVATTAWWCCSVVAVHMQKAGGYRMPVAVLLCHRLASLSSMFVPLLLVLFLSRTWPPPRDIPRSWFLLYKRCGGLPVSNTLSQVERQAGASVREAEP